MNSLASSAADGMNEAHSGVKQPVRICIAALGGEGGSVLTSWLVALAKAQDWPVQSTSVPGVAQRTGATTYYLEILPERWQGHGRPVLALTPTPGFVDVVVASELLEAGRAIEQGLVSPERTTVIASTHRAYLIEEKSAMSDERVPTDRIVKAVDQLSARAIYMDFAELAREAGAVVSSVIFGAIAGAGVLPAPRESFETALRESGIAVEANLRGFAAAYDAVTVGRRPRDDTNPESTPEFRPKRSGFPAEIDAVVSAGIERLTEYQGSWYAERYSSAVRRVFEAEISSGDEGAG